MNLGTIVFGKAYASARKHRNNRGVARHSRPRTRRAGVGFIRAGGGTDGPAGDRRDGKGGRQGSWSSGLGSPRPELLANEIVHQHRVQLLDELGIEALFPSPTTSDREHRSHAIGCAYR